MPLGVPSATVSMLNNRSAIWFFFCTLLQLPKNLVVQQSDEPKLWMVCFSLLRLMAMVVLTGCWQVSWPRYIHGLGSGSGSAPFLLQSTAQDAMPAIPNKVIIR